MFTMDELSKEVAGCTKCRLHLNRSKAVLGEGNPNAEVMFVGEAPGADEDRMGRPFVGKAGQLLDKALSALDFSRDNNYYICNICKCRPEDNRTPADDEAEACLPYLRNQVAIIRPRIIVCLGATSAKHIIDKQARITSIRGSWIEIKGYSIIATYHPAALFRDESKKKLFWEDLKKVKEKYDEIARVEQKKGL